VICLLGAVGPDDVAGLIRSRSGPTRDAAILADIASWADTGIPRGRRGMAAASRGALARHQDDAVALLRAAGWRVAVARADRAVADVWDELADPVAPALGQPPAGPAPEPLRAPA
jgi:hypothetical protein